MPKSSPIQADFSGGEFGPHTEGRVDATKYATGAEYILNYLPTLEGPLTRRPGTKYVANAKDPAKPPKFIPFRFSNTEQYILEFGENYVRFFSDGGQVVTSGTSYVVTGSFNLGEKRNLSIASDIDLVVPFFASRSNNKLKLNEKGTIAAQPYTVFSSVVSGSVLEIKTPYDHNMVQNMGYAQKGDTLWIFHSSIPTFTLQRFSSQDWDLKYFGTKDGPYLPLNSYKFAGDSANTQLRQIYQDGAVAIRTHSAVVISNVVSGTGSQCVVHTRSEHKRKTGDKVWIQGIHGTSEANNGSSFVGAQSQDPKSSDSSVWTVSVLSATSVLLLGSVFVNNYVGSGIMYPALFDNLVDAWRNIALYSGSIRYFGYIQSGSSVAATYPFGAHPIQCNFVHDFDSYDMPINSTVFNIWQMGSAGRYAGFPSDGCFHQDRLVMTGQPNNPTEVVASKIGEYSSFNVNDSSSAVVTDAHALQFNLVSDSSDLLKWARSGQQGLYFASNSVEFIVRPSRDGQALTPTNINNDIIGYYGSGDISPVRSGDAIIYVQSSERKIRELRYFANIQSHKSTNINVIADHIAFPQMSGLAVQKEFYPIVWGYKTDGNFISMSYSRDESEVRAGWANHTLGGRSDSASTHPNIKAMEVIKDSTGKYDQLWMAVQRYINGTSVVTIEYLSEPYRHKDPAQKQRDAYYLDCGSTYDSPVTITGITQGSALVTAANHLFSNNDMVLVDDVIGLNSSLFNVNGILVNSNLVNGKIFLVHSSSTNSFFLQDFNSSIIETLTYSPYFSGGTVRKLVSSVSGLTWLKNEEVDVLADGGIHGKATVASSGVLALNYPAAVVQIGYSYASRGKTLVKENGSRTGSAIGTQRKTYEVAFRLKDVGDFKYGGIDFNNLHQANLYDADSYQADSAVPLYSGIYRDGIEQDIGFYGQVYFEQSSPLPGMIQSITFMMDQDDL